MSSVARERIEVWSKAIAMIVGLVSAVGIVLGLFANKQQRAHELRWQQANLAREMVSSMLQDSLARSAMLMVDWDNRSYTINGESVQIPQARVWEAIDTARVSLDPTDMYIRDSFDRLFFHMAGLERAITTGLICADDVRSPVAFYVGRLAPFRDRVKAYMESFGYSDAVGLLSRYGGQTPAPPAG